MRAALFLLSFAVLAQSSKIQSTDAELGRAAFRIYCAPCHGRNAEGGRGPDLTTGRFVAGDRDEDLVQVIQQGVPGTEMRGYAATIARENVDRLVAYIRSRAVAEAVVVKGDAAVGEKVFWAKGGCGACHRAAGRGGAFGPDLSRIGRTRSAKHLREALLDPDANLTSGYRALTVKTRDGKTITGLNVGLDLFSARVLEQNGTYHSFLREELTLAHDDERSLMPSYQGKLTDEELNSLLVYLLSLKGEGLRP